MAKAFHFNLQKVLDLRQLAEDLQAVHLHKAQSTLFFNEQQLDSLEDDKTGVLQVKSNPGSIALSLHQLKVSTDYVYQLNQMIDGQKQKVDRSQTEVGERRTAWQEASKSKKIVEKLKEKEQLRHKKQINKKMLKDESEIALRVARQARNEDRK